MNFIGKLFRKNNPQMVGVTTYPDKIVFVTQHQIKHSYWTSSAATEILPYDASNENIGETILKQLSLSRYGIKAPNEAEQKEINLQQKKLLNFKSVKESMKDSRYIAIVRGEDKILFEPTINGGSTGSKKGYRYFDETLEIDSNSNCENLGEMYRKALEKCK